MPGNRDDIFDPIALTKLNRKADLINRLNLLHKRLGEVSQDPADRPASLEALSTYLISKKILNHVDKDVRLLACCCLVDILRIYAPDAPFNDSEMVMVFDVMVSQIRSLSTYNSQSATGSKVVYILSSLSTVKSCVVPVILAQSGVPGAEEVVTSLFDALISSFRPEHGEEGA
jgi:sister-chromatid-cohesion protein PDS5